MPMQRNHQKPDDGGIVRMWDNTRRAFAEFLLVPTCILLAFMALAVVSHFLDRSGAPGLSPFRHFLKAHIFADAKATSDLLGAIAGSIITMASLTITLLLIVVQQTASSMTSQVYDQFLRRRINQVYFGFFVGLALYALVILSTVDTPFNPVYGAGLALILAIAALYLLLVLIYTTINQMRPAVIIGAIHDQILAARRDQRTLIHRTLRASRYAGAARVPARSVRHGFVTRLNLDRLKAAVEGAHGNVEIELEVSIGSPVAYGDVLAYAQSSTPEDAEPVVEAVVRAIHIEDQRDVETDPAFGIEQLQTIAWTSVSTAKSNPAPGLLTIYTLRDILARWADAVDGVEQPRLPIVYRDNVPECLMDAFEALAIVSSESMQHQIFTAVAGAFATMLERLSPDQQRRAEGVILRMLSVMGDLVLTSELDATLTTLGNTLARIGRPDAAAAVRAAHQALGRSVGKLNSRATRVPES